MHAHFQDLTDDFEKAGEESLKKTFFRPASCMYILGYSVQHLEVYCS